MAMQLLMVKLKEIERIKNIVNSKTTGKILNTWGEQFRSYILQPYQLVKDTRISLERHDVQKVLEGDLDAFINKYHYYYYENLSS